MHTISNVVGINYELYMYVHLTVARDIGEFTYLLTQLLIALG